MKSLQSHHSLHLLATCALILWVKCASSKTAEHMIISKTRTSDQDGSATDYTYKNDRNGVPVSYVRYTTHTNDPAEPQNSLRQYRYSYPKGELFEPYPRVYQPYYKTNYAGGYYNPVVPYNYGQYYGPQPGPYYYPVARPEIPDNHVVDEHGHEYESSGGAEKGEEDHEESGDKGKKGYESHQEYEDEEKAHEEKESDEGHHRDEGAHKDEHSDQAEEFHSHDNAEHEGEGQSYDKTKYHKKGHKTTGFHKVYRKDEYKKDSDFYDEDHDGGQFEKHGEHDAHRKGESGAYAKAGKHDAGYEKSEHGHEADYDQGHHNHEHKGHKGVAGSSAHDDHHEDYDKGDSLSYAKEKGFKHGSRGGFVR